MSLQIPRFLYGNYAEVRRAVGKRVTELRRGRTLAQIAGDEWIDVESDPDALIVLARRWSMISADRPQFHIDQLWNKLERTVPSKLTEDATYKRCTEEALVHAWAFAGLLASQAYNVVATAAQQLDFIDAGRKHWPLLANIGRRYTEGGNTRSLDRVPTLLGFSLARQGAADDAIFPLTTAKLEDLCASLPGYRVRDKLERGDIDGALELLRGHGDIALASLAEHFLRYGHDDRVCAFVTSLDAPDPHGLLSNWLAGKGDANRTVR